MNTNSPFYSTARPILENCFSGLIQGVIAQQNLLEMYAILTDSKRVTHPIPGAAAMQEIENLTRGLKVIWPTESTLARTMNLMRKYAIRKPKVYDVYLIATALDANVNTILTYNDRDFMPFNEIKVIHPNQEKI